MLTKMIIRRFAALISISGCLSLNTYAASIGRTEVELPSSRWTLLTTYSTDLKFTGGMSASSTSRMQSSVYQLPGVDGIPKALLHITSSHNSYGEPVAWRTNTCPPARPNIFSQDFGTNTTSRNYQCLLVIGTVSPAQYFKPESEVMQAIRDQGLKLFPYGHMLFCEFGTSSGTFLHVNLITQKGFKGLPGKTPATSQTQGVAPDLIAWGESLHQAVADSVWSFSGRLELPPIEFKE